MTKQQNEDLLQRIVPYLLLNYSFVEDNSLLYGKMGGVLFFNLYARATGQHYYRQYADELFDSITETLSIASPIDFGWGLCGIGWGVEYIIRNGLQDGNTDDLLEEIDRAVMVRDPLRFTDMSFDTGLKGMLFYITTRMSSSKRQRPFAPFDQPYLDALSETVRKNMDRIPKGLSTHYQTLLSGGGSYGRPMIFPGEAFGKLPQPCVDFDTLPIGIKGGLTGLALKVVLS